MHGSKFKKVLLLFLLMNLASGQDEFSMTDTEKKEKSLCVYCTCSEIPSEDVSHLVFNVQCSELDRTENLPDLDKIEWPSNQNGLKMAAAFEGLGLSTLGKLPPNSQIESLRFNNNAIKTYWPDPFADVPNLKKLSFYQNDLTEVTPDLFTNIQSLEELDISYNKLSGFNPLDFKTLANVKKFNLQSNWLKKIPIEALLPMKSLEDLDLSKNGIFDLLLQKSSDALNNLRRLNLNGNRIRSVMKDSFPENNSLELLDLSNNIIEIVEEDTFLSCPNLRELNLGQNNITFIFALPPSLQIAIFRQNTIYRWPNFPTGITYIDLSFNRLTELYKEQVTNFENLEVLNIAGNQLKQMTIETKLPKLFTLDISYNLLEEIPSSLSSQILPTLEELKIDGNPIRSIYFKNIIALKTLSMNELNLLNKVEDKSFSNVIGRSVEELNDSNCFSLYLSNCHSLSEIDKGAFDGTSVCMLDLSRNNLTSLSQDLLVWSSVVDGVDLQWNPWRCDCSLQWLLDSLPTLYKDHDRLLSQLRCESPRGLQGLRLVHWYNWTEKVFCSNAYRKYDSLDAFSVEPTMERGLSLSNVSNLSLILGGSIIVALLIAIALTVYLVKDRRRYRVRQAAMKRKRQSAIDARNSNGEQKEQYSALNKI